MKFGVSSSELLKQLQIAGGAIGTNQVLPILEDFLFTIYRNRLKIAATDLETSITTEIPIDSDGEGQVAVPAKILLETLKALPEQPITFSIDEEKFGIEITSNYGKYKLVGENGQDFPTIPDPEEVDSLTIDASVLGEAIGKTFFAASNDELRPAMTGILLEVDFDKLTFVATDAHKLVRFSSKKPKSDVSTRFIIPKKALQLLKNALPPEGDVRMSFNKSNAFFSFDQKHMTCRLIDAKYPDYKAVIPVGNQNMLIIRRQDFQNSLKRIAIYANKTTYQVILDISDGSLTISAKDLDFSNEATEQLPCSYDGDPLKIAFNAKFLIEMLSVLDSEDIKMELASSSKAGLLLPAEEMNGQEVLMLVMPVMLNT